MPEEDATSEIADLRLALSSSELLSTPNWAQEMEIVGRLASQAPSKEHHSLSEGQPELVEPSPVYILKTSPRPLELPELEDELEVEVGAAADEDGA